jgi:hypothetical protein
MPPASILFRIARHARAPNDPVLRVRISCWVMLLTPLAHFVVRTIFRHFR